MQISWYNNTCITNGRVSEWFKEPVLKTGDVERHRWLEHLNALFIFKIYSLHNIKKGMKVVHYDQHGREKVSY